MKTTAQMSAKQKMQKAFINFILYAMGVNLQNVKFHMQIHPQDRRYDLSNFLLDRVIGRESDLSLLWSKIK